MRTTVSLPDGLARLARREARRRGISLSAVIRESLEASFRTPSDAELPWQGIVNDPGVEARSLDAALADTWADDIAGHR